MTLDTTLSSLGVSNNTLSDAEKTFLEEQGYLPLIDLLSAEEVASFNQRLDELAELEGEDAGKEVHQEAGAVRLSNLIDKDPMFEKCVTHPLVLAAICHVLGSDFKLSSLNSRAALPGQGHQALHTDWSEPINPGEYRVCNSIWLLDDFSADNGATRIIPGSHLSGKRPIEVLDDPSADHPEQIQLEAKAGTVVIFNSHVWHGGGLNHTDRPRRAMHCYFCQREHPQQLDQTAHLSRETIARLSPQARTILDVDVAEC